MFNLIYYFFFLMFNVIISISICKNIFIKQLISKKTLKKKSFFNLSVFEQFYLIFFYHDSKYFSYYQKILSDHKIIYLIRNSKYITLNKIFSKSFSKNITTSLLTFVNFIKLWRFTKIFKLVNFWKVLSINFNLGDNITFLSFIILNKLILICCQFFSTSFNLSSKNFVFNTHMYTFIFHNLFLKKNYVIFDKKKQLIFLHNYKNQQLNFKKYEIKQKKFLKNFIKINIFLKRFNLMLEHYSNHWRWIYKNINMDSIHSLNNFFKKYLIKYTPIRYNPTIISKYTTEIYLKKIKIYFLRKTKIFNKSRYSRNRQIYRTGVYWCLWLSIFLGWGLYFIFYRYTLTFSYLWWIIYIGLSLFIFIKTLKYRFYNFSVIISEITLISKWIYLLIFEFIKYPKTLVCIIIKTIQKVIIINLLNFNFLAKLTFLVLFGFKDSKKSFKLLKNKTVSSKDFFFNLLYPFNV